MRVAVLPLSMLLVGACDQGTQFEIEVDAYKQPCVVDAELSTCYRIKTEFEREFSTSTYTIRGLDYQWGTAVRARVHYPKSFGANTAPSIYEVDSYSESEVPPGTPFDLISRLQDNTSRQTAFTFTSATEGHLADGKAFVCDNTEACGRLSDFMDMAPGTSTGTIVVHALFAEPVSGPIHLTGLEQPR